jgi:hypothetical protein
VSPGTTSLRMTWVIAMVLAAWAWWSVASAGRERPIDRDEGIYLEACRRIQQGDSPYLDFYFPQMPLMPWLYAVVLQPGPGDRENGARAGAVSLSDARTVSVGLTALLVAMAAVAAALTCARPGSRVSAPAVALGVGAAVAVNPAVLSDHATVKTIALADLLLPAAVLAAALAARAPVSRGLLRAGLAGLALGVAGLAKLYLLPVGAVLAVALALPPLLGWQPGGAPVAGRRPGRAAARLGCYLLGALLGLSPAFALASKDAERFWWNNVGFHVATHAWRVWAGQSRTTLVGGLEQLASFVVRPSTLTLIAAAAGALALQLHEQRQRQRSGGQARQRWLAWLPIAVSPPLLSLIVAVLLSMIFVGPMDPFIEYWTISVPLLALAAAPLFATIGEPGWLGRRVAPLAPLLIIAVGIIEQTDERRRWRAHEQRRAIDSPAVAATVAADARRFSRAFEPYSRIFSLWPGYGAMAGIPPQPGTEGGVFGWRLLDGTRGVEESRIINPLRAAELLRQGIPEVVVRSIDWQADLDAALLSRYREPPGVMVPNTVFIRRAPIAH